MKNEVLHVTKITREIPFGEHTLVLETGEIARQADGAVFANMNGTQVLATVVARKEASLSGKNIRSRKNPRRF
jgi:polyribonucleotide nucleotidyltransferase